MILYLTFTNELNGIYRSQVLDVCSFLRREFGVPVKVVAIVSGRRFWPARSAFRSADPEVLVLPMVPGVRNWRMNRHLLRQITRRLDARCLIGRSEFATQLGLTLREEGILDTVAFDGRSARAAECAEYDGEGRGVFSSQEIGELEGDSVRRSDFRIAVSGPLVEYWRREYAYEGSAHRIVPCTVVAPSPKVSGRCDPLRKELGFEDEQIVLVYAGSSAQWQSFDLLDRFVVESMQSDPRIALLMLTPPEARTLEVDRAFPSRVVRRWVEPGRVPHHLAACDYGLLLRESKVTNRVSSPTKFGEYLQAGLGVLVSENVGDCSRFVQEHRCGFVVSSAGTRPVLAPLDLQARSRHAGLAQRHYSKVAHRDSYRALLEALGAIDSGVGSSPEVGTE